MKSDMDPIVLMQDATQAKRENRFGDAINLYMQVIESPDATDELRRHAATSIEIIQEINGFVNADLMNP